ncbi:PREDICTED: taste receptor type 2 member 16 [Hipposideros armiger]|uniref:Taste receptor type 2 n=1 Tax=Hipposideros armiger TaxID=186990 RepID=A0A8B7QJL6_HIPAR|nr:PREDICTED: taste receptor type 2 member 16 [Hipposideros armiger]
MIPIQLTVFFMVIYVLESLIIMVQNSLIVAVLGREWAQAKRMSPVDMILISLSFCRFCLQWSSMLHNFCFYFNLDWVVWHVSVIWEFNNTLSFWLTGLLAVVYCVKLSSFTHPIFLWLRWRILRLVPWLLLGSLLISCGTIIFSAIRHHMSTKLSSMAHLPRNNTVVERLTSLVHNFMISQHLVMLTVPFLLFLASSILLIASLSQHLGQMQHHSTGHSNSSMKAQTTVLKSLSVVLIFFTSYFLMIFIATVDSLFAKSPWFWMWETIIYALVSIHSTSIMLSNPKLKKVLKVRCWGLEAA